MAVSLLEAQNLSQNLLVKGIVEEMINESPLIKRLPFQTLVGNALAINREDASNMGSVGFKAIGDILTESAAQFTQVTYSLTTLTGDCDVNNLIQKSMSNINDQMAAQVKIKSKLMANEFETCAIYGDDTNTNEFDGLHVLVDTTNMAVHAGTTATGAALTLAKLDELCDKIRGGKPDMLLMNRNVRRRLSAYLRTVGSYATERDKYGDLWMYWQDIPIVVSDFITQTETISSDAYAAKTGGDTSSIFAIRFGEGDALCGLQNGGIDTQHWDRLESKDAQRTRLIWYCGLALYSTKAIAVLDGVTDAAMSA
jgi:RNA polymerase subunit RPABC4/transcription elongation factor Spt4